ncbi:MAG: SprT family zinc-dependent metalloprotease [Alphaproteobacteria bacterium]
MINLFLLTSKVDELKTAVDFEIIINQSPKAKRMSLKIDVQKKLPILTLPKYFSKKQALDFLDKHQCWIENKLSALPQTKTFGFGDSIKLFDVEYIITPDTNCISCCKIKDNCLLAPNDKELLNSRIIKFIKKHAKEKLEELSKQKAATIGYKINNVVIKDTKSRWGSCSSKGNINYSFRLALAPLFVADSIVAHEVCHLKEHNHGDGFYNLLYKICPDYDKAEHWLKLKSKELYAYK